MALAEITGVSGGSAHTVPSLLLPGSVSGSAFGNMTDVTCMDDADIGTTRCHRLKGRFANATLTLWIDAKTNLLLPLDSSSLVNKIQYEEKTTYEPGIDVEVTDAELEFVPRNDR